MMDRARTAIDVAHRGISALPELTPLIAMLSSLVGGRLDCIVHFLKRNPPASKALSAYAVFVIGCAFIHYRRLGQYYERMYKTSMSSDKRAPAIAHVAAPKPAPKTPEKPAEPAAPKAKEPEKKKPDTASKAQEATDSVFAACDAAVRVANLLTEARSSPAGSDKRRVHVEKLMKELRDADDSPGPLRRPVMRAFTDAL